MPRRIIAFCTTMVVILGTLSACGKPESVESTQASASRTDDTAQSTIDSHGDSGSVVDAAQAQMEYASLFEGDGILTMNIAIDPEDWEALLANATDKEYYSATVTVGDITLENVGVRAKGNSTLRAVSGSDSDRYSLRIKFDKYEDGQNLLGLDEMVVNNNYSDPSYLREYLTYEALAAIGLQSPLTSFVNLSINGQLFGFYLGVEAVDDSLLERFYGNSTGNLYKAEERSTLVYQEGSTYDTLDQKNGKDKSREDLVSLVRVLDEMEAGDKGSIESILDVDSALRYIAGMTVLGSYDSYNGSFAHNYYLCANDGIFSVIPWDYNMSFGGFMDRNGDSVSIPIDEPVSGVSMESRPLIQKLLAVPEYRERYHQYVSQLCDYLEGFEERLNEMADLIRPYVEADPTAFFTIEQFEANLVDDNTVTADDQDDSVSGSGQPEVQTMSADGTPPTPPDGFPEDAAPPGLGGESGQQWGGPGGGGGRGMQSAGSILTYAKNRLENVRKQLSGELATTGNTTMDGDDRGGGWPQWEDGFAPGERPDGEPPPFREGEERSRFDRP